MKSLKINPIEAQNILSGVQTATLRMRDDKDLSVDDEIEVIDKVKTSEPNTWEAIGSAKINEVQVRRAGDLEIQCEGYEQFGSLNDLYQQLEVFYGDPIDDHTHIKVIHFTFTPYKKAKPYEKELTSSVEEIKMYSDGGSRGNP